jgi:hypothetical protein
MDVQTASILLRAQITKLVLCSAVDKPLVAYDATAPQGTGCDSPGYLATQVFPLVIEEEDKPQSESARHHRTPADMYQVRQRGRSLFIKRRLLDVHSPTVWMQATIELRDERGRIVQPADRVEMTRFQVPDRALAIGYTLPPVNSLDTSSLTDRVLKFLNFRGGGDDSAVDEALRDYDELDGREDMNNGTNTRFYNHVHWTSYTAVIFGGLFAVVLLFVVIARWARPGGGLRRRLRGAGGRKSHLSDGEQSPPDLEMGRARQINNWIDDAVNNGIYHTTY